MRAFESSTVWDFFERGVTARSAADAERSRARQRNGFLPPPVFLYQVKGFISFSQKRFLVFVGFASSSAVALEFGSKLSLLSARQFFED